jgi:2-polyprenyl-3-methyl-5-hydroxy-6-metoxy-1,4-benzoquinol methylase
MGTTEFPCGICGEKTGPAGRKFGEFSQRWYELRHCPACRFSFVANPWTDFAAIYSEDYYRGKGADPFTDYEFEFEHPGETIRVYEWEGLLRVVSGLVPIGRDTRWLDFGCGNGGLVRYVKQQRDCGIAGFDEGHFVARMRAAGLPFISRETLEKTEQAFDVITSLEVLEHTVDPMETLRWIRRLLKPGGLFFLTTGNAKRFRGRLARWPYVIPEIHVSLFEPDTLARAMRIAGLEPEFRGWLPGFEKIIQFKVLKSLGIRRRCWLERLIPLPALSRVVDARVGVSRHPLAWAARSPSGPELR